MSKETNYRIGGEAVEIMERILQKFPKVFPEFDMNQIGTIFLCNKKITGKNPVQVKPVGFPAEVWANKVYIFVVYDDEWQTLSQKQKNLAIFKAMCSIPDGGCDPESKTYGKKRKPDYEMYAEEYAVTGGVPDWMNNPAARDVFDVGTDDGAADDAVRVPGGVVAELEEMSDRLGGEGN